MVVRAKAGITWLVAKLCEGRRAIARVTGVDVKHPAEKAAKAAYLCLTERASR